MTQDESGIQQARETLDSLLLGETRAAQFEHTPERIEAAVRLLDAVPAGADSDVGGRSAVKRADGLWDLEADEDRGLDAEPGLTARQVVDEHWCCMHPGHWPTEPLDDEEKATRAVSWIQGEIAAEEQRRGGDEDYCQHRIGALMEVLSIIEAR